MSFSQTQEAVIAAKLLEESGGGGGEIQMTPTVKTLCNSSGSTITLLDNTNNYDLLFCQITAPNGTEHLVIGAKSVGEMLYTGIRVDISGTTVKAYWYSDAVNMTKCKVIGVKFSIS